jgi:hypothetical protein
MKHILLVIALVLMVLVSLVSCTGGETSTTPPVVGVKTGVIPVTIEINETVGVSDLNPVQAPVVAEQEETASVADFATIVPAIKIDITETVGVTDSHETRSLPVINFFIADPDRILRGGSSVLNWSTSGATTVTIDHDIGSVSAVGRKIVTPFNTTTYTLKATNSYGSVTATVTVTVNIIRF